MDMDPLTLGLIAALVLGLLLAAVLIRAWIRGMIRMVKMVIWGGLSLLVLLAIGGAVTWFLYGDQIRAALG